jgi:hypothetical protein
MKFVIAFNFIVLALIMMGLYVVSNANYRALNPSAKYWSWAVVLDAIGLALLGGTFLAFKDFSEHTFIGTISNTALFASLIYQALSMQAVRSDAHSNKHYFALAFILVFGIGWDYLRVHATVNQKILIFAVVALAILVWQIYELSRDIHKKKSRQLTIVLYSVGWEVFFTSLRILAVSDIGIDIMNAEQLPMLGIISVWLQYGLKIIAYAALVGYWSEQLAIKKVAAEIEAQEFKALSERQEKLIADLGRLNKAAYCA